MLELERSRSGAALRRDIQPFPSMDFFPPSEEGKSEIILPPLTVTRGGVCTPGNPISSEGSCFLPVLWFAALAK